MKNLLWDLFKKTGQVRYYILAKKLDNTKGK
jgi:hypothetical protein